MESAEQRLAEVEENRISLANRLTRAENEVRRIAAQRDEFEAEKDGAWAEVQRLRRSADADLYGMELGRRLIVERKLAAVLEVVETYESCGPKQQSTRDVLAAVRVAIEEDR